MESGSSLLARMQAVLIGLKHTTASLKAFSFIARRNIKNIATAKAAYVVFLDRELNNQSTIV